uniref:Photosystem II Psb31 protein domain-containing protein n=1 Tax=Chromera velia CCMP2878 TaxID=1169474 RepID=A0A0G4GQD1_9ALVE|eukprot:Cvel_22911.t1-p1 / transcript=Cvel_22911.t1 / gene=Cvel_22911 / organism=Chromera_velia_CCMP2878 / gene_product=hypothetical protein / transcript_product=hypothetical protein / location=Cvel_scaffold2302:24911-26033(+) / protein_length=210 / sequence_SO=supercontig / SO=protein_coding / is_pseudo=false
MTGLTLRTPPTELPALKMKFLLAVSFCSAATAFLLPASPSLRASRSSLEAHSRRDTVEQVAQAALVAGLVGSLLPRDALADGPVNRASVQRAQGFYGLKVLELESEIQKGNLKKLKKNTGLFDLYAKGAFALSTKEAKADAVAKAEAVKSAIEAGDVGAIKTSYASFKGLLPVELTDPSRNKRDNESYQGYGTEFDWKRTTAFQGNPFRG